MGNLREESIFVCGSIHYEDSIQFTLLSRMRYASKTEFRKGFTRLIRGVAHVLEVRPAGDVVAAFVAGPIPHNGQWEPIVPVPRVKTFSDGGARRYPMSQLHNRVLVQDVYYRSVCGDSWPTPDREAGCCQIWQPPDKARDASNSPIGPLNPALPPRDEPDAWDHLIDDDEVQEKLFSQWSRLTEELGDLAVLLGEPGGAERLLRRLDEL